MTSKLLGLFVGSFPHEDAASCIDEIIQATPQVPSWPQLPRRHVNEHFLVQWGFGLPGAQFNEELAKWIIPNVANSAEHLATFYEQVFSAQETGDLAAFACRPEVQPGFFQLNDVLVKRGEKPPFAKGQLIGPVSFGLGLEDEEGTRVFFREDYRDALVQAIALQARWQMETLSKLAEKVICFIDEPYLQSYGSSDLIAIKREDVLDTLGPVIQAVQDAGGIAGVHVCGNTEWPLIMDAGADLINFDAYIHGESLLLYPKELTAFLRRGGLVAWGLIPTAPEAIDKETAQSLATRMNALFDQAETLGISRQTLAAQSMISPACGLGTLDLAHARKAMALVQESSALLREQFGFTTT